MKNMMMITALALISSASAQSGTRVPQPQAPAVQDTLKVRSYYDQCLMTAGQHTWTALGLNTDQIDRANALQGRYKAMMAPPPETPKKDAKKAKKDKASDAVNAGNDKRMEKDADLSVQPVAPSEQPVVPVDTKVEVPAQDPAMADLNAQQAAPLSVDEELRLILTPEQLALWDVRCGSQPTGMVQP